MTNIKLLKDKIIFDGHSDTREECETITLMCDNLAKSKDFKTVEYKDGYAEFERISNAKELKFPSALCDVTINFDSHITKVTSPDTYQWSTSGQTQSGLNAGSSGRTFTVTLEDGYIIDTVTNTDADDVSNITSNTFTSTLNGDGIPITFTITSKLAPYRFKHYRNPESLGGTPLNIVYSDTAPSDTSKLWVKSSVPSEITFGKDIESSLSNFVWLTNMLNSKHSLCVGVVGTKIYYFGGGSGSADKSIYVFDTETNTKSTTSATLPIAVVEAQAVAVGTKIYMFGGQNSSGTKLNTIYTINTETNTVTASSATLPSARKEMAISAVGTKIYLFGGYASSELNTICVFDTTTNNISTLSTTLPTASRNLIAGAIDKIIYIFDKSNKTIYTFDTETNSISTLSTTLPTPLTSTAIAVMGDKIYFVGGSDGVGYVTNVYMFDSTTNTVSITSSTVPLSKISNTSLGVVGSKIFSFGGYSSGSISRIFKSELKSSLSTNNIFVKESLTQNLFDLMSSPTRVEIGIDKVYKGNASNNAELCDAYLHDGTNWVNVNTGENYVEPTPSKSVTINVTNYSNAGDTIIINNGEPIDVATLYYANQTFNDVTSLIVNKQSGDVCYYIINGEQKDFANYYGENDLTDELQTGANTLELYFDD